MSLSVLTMPALTRITPAIAVPESPASIDRHSFSFNFSDTPHAFDLPTRQRYHE